MKESFKIVKQLGLSVLSIKIENKLSEFSIC